MIDLDDLDDYDLDRLLTVPEAAELLGLRPNGLYARTMRGNGPRVYNKANGKGYVSLYSPWEIKRYLEEHVDGRKRK